MKTATELAQKIADQELEACCEWVANRYGDDSQAMSPLRAARRPRTIPETIEVDGHVYRLIK